MKKLSAILVCLLMIVTCMLAGCATFSIDKVKYYNEVVASVGEEKITRYDLLNAYSSYGQNYYASQLGQSEQDALKSTLNLLTKRESLYQYAKANLTLTEYEVNSAMEEMFKSIDEQMTNYVATAKTIFNITSTISSSTESEETAYKISDYYFSSSRRAKLSETDNTKIEYIVSDKTYTPVIDEEYLKNPFKDGVVNEVVAKYTAHFKNGLKGEEQQDNLYNKAISLLADDLINYEYYLRDANNKPYNTVTNDLLYRYFERNYNSQIKGAYLTKIRSNYLSTATNRGELNTTKLLEEYSDLYTESYEKYVNNKDLYKTDMANISTKADDILYHPTFNDGTQFGYFIHTLISFDEEGSQKSALDAAKTYYNNDSSPNKETTYNTERNRILSLTEATERDLSTGLIIKDAQGNPVKRNMDYILTEYSKVNSLPDFIKFMFRFTNDAQSTLVPGMPYVLGCDATYDGTTKDGEKYKGSYSGMVTEFTKEGLDLMLSGNTMSEKLVAVDASKMCVTTYGIHFIYYVGPIDPINDPDPETAYFSNVVTGGDNLCKTLNPLTGETYFDKLFDAVYPTDSNEEVYASVKSYDAYEESLIDNSKITIDETKLNGTKTSI